MRDFFDNIFALGLFAFIFLGSLLVVIQIFGVVTLNGALAIWAKATFAKTAYVIAGVTGVVAFLLSYLHGWKSSD